MKTHRELLDNYYEASWALAMEQVAIRQGEQAGELEKRLDEDPAAAVPPRTVKRCRAVIRRAFTPAPAVRVRKMLYRVVLAAVLCGMIATAACAISPRVREFFAEIFYSISEKFTAITLRDPAIEDVGENQGSTGLEYNGIRFEWLPEGYEYVSGEEMSQMQSVKFENAQSEIIQVRVTVANDMSAYTYDSESGDSDIVMVGDFEGWMVEKNEVNTLTWVDDQKKKVIYLVATNLGQEKILQFARGIKY